MFSMKQIICITKQHKTRILWTQIGSNSFKYLSKCCATSSTNSSSVSSGAQPVAKRRFRLPVEQDVQKLVNYCANYFKYGDELKLKADEEYKDWIWSLRLNYQPPIHELEENTKDMYERLAVVGKQREWQMRTILSTNQQIRGLIVILLSKAYSYPKHLLENFDSETNRLAVINKCQQRLAEITDMIHVSHILHKGVIDLPINNTTDVTDTQLNEDLHLGNTISVLIGDFLLAQSSRGLALIRNPTITGLISKAISNYSESEFLRLELLKQNNCLESLEKYCYLSGGSLLAHSCKSAILLAQYEPQKQSEAFDIGKHIGIAFQLSDLLYRLSKSDNKNDIFGQCLQSIDMNSVKQLLESNVRKAVNLIDNLDKCEASNALSEIVLNIENIQNINKFQ